MDDSREHTRELRRAVCRGPFRIRVVSPGREQVRTLRSGQSVTLGSGDDADLQIDDPTVSGLHCRLHADCRGLEIVDLQSRNGLVLGSGWVGQALLSGPRAEFSIGSTAVTVEAVDREPSPDALGLVGVSDGMQRVREMVVRFAKLSAPVLIVGESGTGKDLVARALHQQSGRSGNYVPLNVAALPDSLLDAELFGHARGAFTGAVSTRAGAFEIAHKGTLFLDEMAEMSMSGQAKLLRVVEDGAVRPLGSADALLIDARIVSATCAPLAERIEQGLFRHDLYHRLSMLVIEVPPLRRRTVDIGPLVEAFLRNKVRELGQKYLLPAALDFLSEQAWPGNVRQLFGAVYRAAVMSQTEALCPSHFQLIAASRGRVATPTPEQARALLDAHGSVSAAARAAGLPRSTFRSILARAVGSA